MTDMDGRATFTSNLLIGTKKPMYAMRWVFLVIAYCIFYAVYFSPVLMQHRILAFADGSLYYYPNFLNHFWNIWSDRIFVGYPTIGDLQAQLLYLPRLLISDYNWFVISSYVTAAVGMFGLVLKLTRSAPAAVIASLVAGSGGFMMAHLGHVSIIHAASWGPLILWSIAGVRDSKGPLWVVAGAFAVCMCLLGGHPQPSIYCLLLALAYATYEGVSLWRSNGARQGCTFLARAFALFVIGGLLSAICWLPFLETVGQGVRDNWTIADFNSYSLDWYSLILILFPYYFGGGEVSGLPYMGPPNLAELTVYVGILPILLASSAMLSWSEDKKHHFWAGAAAIALILTLGTLTPLGGLLAQLPGLGRFRCQARFGIVLLFSTAVLAGYGTAALLRARPVRAVRIRILFTGFLFFVLAIGLAAWGYPELVKRAAAAGLVLPAFWANPTILVPLGVFVIAISAWGLLLTKPGSISAMIAIAVLIIDLGSFGYVHDWRYASSEPIQHQLTGDANAFVRRISSTPGRVLPTGDVTQIKQSPFEPNINSIFEMDSVVGYGPIVSERRRFFAGMRPDGGLATYDVKAPLLDVLGVRWFAVERQGSAVGLGKCNATEGQRSVRVAIPAGHARDQLRIVSTLGCSVGVPDGASVASIQFLDGNQRALGTANTGLRAGVNTAEFAYDRDDVRSVIKHQRAHVFASFPASGVDGHWYDALVTNAFGDAASLMEIALDPALTASVSIKSMEAIAPDGTSVPLTVLPDTGDLHDFVGLPYVQERKNFRGLVWQLCRARELRRDLLASALIGKGREFDVFSEALIERGVDVPKLDCRSPSRPEVLQHQSGLWKLKVDASGNSLVVVSDSYDGGWQASVDGEKRPIVPVDGLILGVEVSSGQHVVEMRYLPSSFLIGSALTGGALLLCLFLLGLHFYSARRNRQVVEVHG